MKRNVYRVLPSILIAASAYASTPEECIRAADGARAEMLRYKSGESDEATVKKSTAMAEVCIQGIDPKGKSELKAEALAAWKAFRALREEKILPTVVRYNQTAKDNKANLDKTKQALAGLGESGAECSKKADEARAALLLFKDGKGDLDTVNRTAKETSRCIDGIDAKGNDNLKTEAASAWKVFRSIREGKIIPDVEYFTEQSNRNTVNLNKTKDALKKLASVE